MNFHHPQNSPPKQRRLWKRKRQQQHQWKKYVGKDLSSGTMLLPMSSADSSRRLQTRTKKLDKLIEGIGAYAGTMINLHDLLKTSFPVRFTENDRLALQEEVNAIADNAISRIRREREKADKDIRRNENRISVTQTTFWCMIALLLNLASFFAVIVFANMKLLHSETLTEITAVYVGLIAVTFAATFFILYKRKH